MARIRSIKPEAFESESLAKVSVNAERTFFGLSTIADDRGRFPDKPAQVNGNLWAMRGNHTAEDVEDEFCQLVKADGLLCRYVGCDGKRYVHLVTWDAHQKIDKPSKSRLPMCPHHPISVTGVVEVCGLHPNKPCPPQDGLFTFDEISRDPREHSRDPREGSRDFPTGSGTPGETAASPPAVPSAANGTHMGDYRPDLREQQSSRESREPSMVDLGPRTVDLGSVPPSAGAGKPPRRRPSASSGPNAGTVVAAYIDGARAAGLSDPGRTLANRVGKQARQLLDKHPIEQIIESAQRLGASGYNDLEAQVRRDEALARGIGGARASPGRGPSTTDQRIAALDALKDPEPEDDPPPPNTIPGSVIR